MASGGDIIVASGSIDIMKTADWRKQSIGIQLGPRRGQGDENLKEQSQGSHPHAHSPGKPPALDVI
jgi:hypothetical protein